MAELLRESANGVTDDGGRTYTARVRGRARADGKWEGWIEFVPIGEGVPLTTARETTQPKYDDLAYWAAGLTTVYFEGALRRAVDASQPPE